MMISDIYCHKSLKNAGSSRGVVQRVSEFRARSNYHISLLKLKWAKGTIIEDYGVMQNNGIIPISFHMKQLKGKFGSFVEVGQVNGVLDDFLQTHGSQEKPGIRFWGRGYL